MANDYSQVFYVEPNYNTDAEQRINTPYYLHDMEDYCIYVDLEVEIYDRKVEGMNGTKTILFSWKTNVEGKTSASFLEGSKIRYEGANGERGFQSLTTNYLNSHYSDVVADNTKEASRNTEMFGIKTIDIDYNNYAVPQVNITFTDIRGGSFFAPEEMRHHKTVNGVGGFSDDDIAGSFFKCFFTFPYPKFTLRVKGFYGEGVSYELTCAKFNARFDSNTGNFEAVADLVGYSYSLLNDISLNAVLAAPLSDYIGMDYWLSRGGSLTEEEVGDASLTRYPNSDGAFTITAPNGDKVPMPTLNRVLSLMDDLVSVQQGMQDENQDTYLVSSENETMIQVLNSIKQSYNGYCRNVIEEIQKKRENNNLLFTEEDSNGNICGIVYFTLSDSNDYKDIVNVDIKTLKVNVNLQASQLNEAIPDIPQPKIYFDVLDSSIYDVRLKNKEPLRNLVITQAEIQNQISSEPQKFHNGTMVYKNAYIFDGTSFLNGIDNMIQRKTNQKNEHDALIAELDDKIISGVLGFVPTLQNIMAIIMAHLETLLYINYETTRAVDIINSGADYRRLADFGLTDPNLIGLKLTQDEKVPAWPSVVKKDPSTSKWFQAWIGDFPKNGRVQPEADAVNGLLNGIKKLTVSIKEASEAISTPPEATPQTCAARVALPLTLDDYYAEGNPFGSSEIDTSTPTNAIDDVIAKMFVRMYNVFLVDNMSNIEWSGGLVRDVKRNITDSITSEMGKYDAANFFDIYLKQLTPELKNSLSIITDAEVIEKMRKPSAKWRGRNTTADSCLVDLENINNPNSICYQMYYNDKIIPRQNIDLQNYLTNGVDSSDENYVFVDRGYADSHNENPLVIDENIRYFSNLSTAYDSRYIGSNEIEKLSSYESYFNDMFEPDMFVFNEQRLYDKSDMMTFDGSPSELNFCYSFAHANGGNEVKTISLNNKGTIPPYPTEMEEADISQYQSFVPADAFQNTDNNEISVVEGESSLLSKITFRTIGDYTIKEIEREGFSDSDIAALGNYDKIENTDITQDGFIIPTIPFYDQGDYTFTCPNTGYTLFSSREYYQCQNVEAKALLFLDNLQVHNLNKFIEQLKNADGSSFYTTKVNLLLAGGYLYRADKTDAVLFNRVITESPSLFEGGINKRLNNGDDISDLMNINPFAKKQLIDYFIKWANGSEFQKFRNAFELKTANNACFTDLNIDQFRQIIAGEKIGEYTSDNAEYNLSKFVSPSFYANYMKINKDGGLFFRESTDVVKDLTNFYVKPVFVGKKYEFSYNENENRYNNLNSDFKNYIHGFLFNLKELLKSNIEEERHASASQFAREPDTVKEIQIELYKYLKILHDRWLGSTSFASWTKEEFFDKQFEFIDTFYYEIGQRVFVNPIKMCNLICRAQAQKSFSLISFITTLLQENNIAFMCVQNFLKLKTEDRDGYGDTYVNAMKKMFKPISFLDMQRFEDRPHFVSIYKGEPSSKLNINGAEYVDDSFMLNYGNAENWPEAISNKNTDVDGYPIPAFGVTYGSQYQSYFTNIDVGMDSSMVTEQALQAQFMIGSMNSKTGGETSNDREGAINAFALGQDLFTVYSNNSYTCTVTMMGCAWVQPLMYFVLLNVPLFRGSYLIEKVKHHIAPGQMTTTFVGVRMANTLTPFVKSPFYKKNDKLNGSINAKFPNAKFASVENDCEYATFPVLTLNYDGGFTEDILNEVGGYKKYGFVPTEDDTDENRYSTLIEALTCTVIQECGSSNQLAAELVATVLFNRVKKRGDFFIFKHGQIAYDTYSSSSHPDGYDKVLEWVKNVFVNTPMVLVGKTTNVVNPVTIYDNDLLTGEYTQPLVITEDMVQRMLMYCSRQGYDASNENIGKDFHPNQGLEWTPSNWRKQTYLCHHDHTNIYGHVFTSGDGNKKYWTATPKSASYDNGVDRNGLSKFANSFIDAVQKTIDATNKINCTIYGTSGDSTNPDYFYITSSNNTQMATVFDIILNGYSRYAYRIGWICKDSNSVQGHDYPDMIYVELTSGDSTYNKIEVAVFNGSTKILVPSIDNVNGKFYQSLGKKYDVTTNIGFNSLLADCNQFANISRDRIVKLFSDNKASVCGEVVPKKNAESMMGAYSFRILNPSIKDSWARVIQGNADDCGCNKSKEEQQAILNNLFGGECPQNEGIARSYLASYSVKNSSGKTIKFMFHKDLGATLVKALEEIVASGFNLKTVGTYCWRTINNPNARGSEQMSNHSYGFAVDINPSENPFFKSPSTYSGRDSDSEGTMRTVNSKAVQIMKKYGFGWGGKYGDTMHFSILNGT